jgi:hypothetical protein
MLDVGGSRCGNVGRCECGKEPYFVPQLRYFEGLLPRVIKFVRYCGGSTRFGRRMNDEVGFVAEVTESFCQKAEVAVPEELARADGEVGVEEDFQGIVRVI